MSLLNPMTSGKRGKAAYLLAYTVLDFVFLCSFGRQFSLSIPLVNRDPDRQATRISPLGTNLGLNYLFEPFASGSRIRLGSALRRTALAAFCLAAVVGTLLPAGVAFAAHFRAVAVTALHVTAVFAAVFLAAAVAAGGAGGAPGGLVGHRAFRACLRRRCLGKCDHRKNQHEREKSYDAFH